MAAKKQQAEYNPPEYIPCHFVGCPSSAKIARETPQGLAKVCYEHNDALAEKSARAYCAARGLDTPAKQRKFVLDTVKGMKRRFTEPLRAPVEEKELADIEI